MSIEVLKPTLAVVIIGLVGILFQSLLSTRDLPSDFSIAVYFNQFVDACEEEHPNWGRKTCEGVVRGEIWIGMTNAMVLASIGEPTSIEQPRSDDPTYEKWIYRTAIYGEEVLRFQDSILLTLSPGENCTSCGVKPLRPVKE